MPSARRIRFLGLTAVLATLIILYFTSGARETRASPFYQKTAALMDLKRYGSTASSEQPDTHPQKVPRKKVKDDSVASILKSKIADTQDNAMALAKGAQEALKDTQDTLKDRLKQAENMAKKSADDKYRAKQDWELALGIPPREVSKKKDKKAKDKKEKDKKENDKAKDKATGKNAAAIVEVRGDPKPDSSGGEKSVAGRKMMKDPSRPQHTTATAAAGATASQHTVAKANNLDLQGAVSPPSPASAKADDDEQTISESNNAVSKEFHALLAHSPMTIFSKSYCPHSQKAKRILLQALTIKPEPFVVELDGHEMGAQLQELLAEKTGRRTVPNVMINGRSLGGGDEIEKLWKTSELRAALLKEKGIKDVVVNSDGHDGSGSGHALR